MMGKVLLMAISAAVLVYSAVMVVRYPAWLVDDAFILFRYAENLAEHGELNWNVGENPVEGYTGIAMVSLIALATKLSISPVLIVHIIGISSYFLGAVLIIMIFRGFNLGSVAALVLYCTAPFMFTHAWSGLETTMFNSLILLAIFSYSTRKTEFFVVALILLAFTRPEGALLSMILLALYRPLSRNALLAWLVPCLAYFIWRWAYYGQFLPNTFYAKSTKAGIRTENINALRDMAVTYLSWPGLLALILISRDHFQKNMRIIMGTFVFALIILFVYLRARLVMNYSFRFFLPIYILSLLALGGILHRVKPTVKTVVLAGLLISLQVVSNVDRDKMRREIEYSSSHFKLLQDVHIAAAGFLRDCVPDNEWLVVHSDAGSIPYYSRLKTIDFGRLNDEYLARNVPFLADLIDQQDIPVEVRLKRKRFGSDKKGPVHELESRMVEYLYSHDPGAFAFTSYNFQKLDHGYESQIISMDDRFADYALVKKYSSKARSKYFQFVYLRKDIIEEAGIQAFLEDPVRNDDSQPDRSDIDMKTMRTEEPEALWLMAMQEEHSLKKVEYLKKLTNNYPASEHAPEACFMIGFVYSEELDDTISAIEAFRMILQKYAGEKIAESAGFMIESLESGKCVPLLQEESEQ
jgi:hypothetical protein